MALQTVTKQASEQFSVAIEFYGKLPPNSPTIASATASAINNSTLADATATVLSSTTGTVNGTRVLVGVRAGTNAVTYKVTVTATLSDGSILEEDFYLTITNT